MPAGVNSPASRAAILSDSPQPQEQKPPETPRPWLSDPKRYCPARLELAPRPVFSLSS